MKIGELIKERRKQKGMSQNKLAEKTGVAAITIRQYEAGDYTPKLEKLLKIIDVLDIDFSEVLETDVPYSGYKKEEELLKQLLGTPSEIERQNKLLFSFSRLNEAGQIKVVDYSRDLEEINDYLKNEYKKE